MDLAKAEQLAIALISKHLGPTTLWDFKFDNSKRSFGSCQFKEYMIRHRKACASDLPVATFRGVIITLSKPLTELNSEEEVRDTILHEIAHALCGPHVGHSKVWKETANRLGCRAKSCYDSSNVILPPRRYIAKCPNCGEQKEYDRRSDIIFCGDCFGIFNLEYFMVFRKNPKAHQSGRTSKHP